MVCPNNIQIKFTDPLRLCIKAAVPAISRAARQRNQTLYEHSLAVLGPRLWNTLPKDLIVISCQQNFKDNLSSYVFSILDLSPVRAYTSPNKNTLLNWHENKAVALQSGWLATMAC